MAAAPGFVVRFKVDHLFTAGLLARGAVSDCALRSEVSRAVLAIPTPGAPAAAAAHMACRSIAGR